MPKSTHRAATLTKTPMNLIVLITDFGTGSPYVAEMKGAILSIAEQARIVDGTHDVPPQDVPHGAMVMQQLVGAFPAGTVFVAVVDPGVGSARNILLVEQQERILIAPDNGLLSLILERDASVSVVDQPAYWRAEVSSTFHGRDIMGPVAAHLANGKSISDISSPLQSPPIRLKWPQPQLDGNTVLGEVVSIDSFGNLMTNVRYEHLQRDVHPVARFCNMNIQCVATYADQPSGTAVALFGSSGWLEIAIVNGNAQTHFAAKVGDSVSIPAQ